MFMCVMLGGVVLLGDAVFSQQGAALSHQKRLGRSLVTCDSSFIKPLDFGLIHHALLRE